jgi:hypothetical protein
MSTPDNQTPPTFKSFVRGLWGFGQTKPFKYTAWAMAISMAGVWAYVDYTNQPPYMRSIEPTQAKDAPKDRKL